MQIFAYFVLLLLFCQNFVYGAKILFLPTPILDSHRRSMFPIAEALGKKGHEVKMFMENVNAYIKPVSEREKQYVDIDLHFMEDYSHWITNFKAYVNYHNWRRRWTMAPSHLISIYTGARTTNNLWRKEPKKIQELLQTDWDLIVVDAFMSSTGILLSSLIPNATLATYNLAILSTVESYKKSTPFSMAYVPTLFLEDMNYDHRSFWHRTWSVWNDLLGFLTFFLVDNVLFRYYLYRHNPQISLDALHERVAFSLVDFATSFEYTKPYWFTTVHYGGYCPPPDWALATRMQSEVEQFINDPRSKGTIVVAFGQIMGWKHAPEYVQKNFVDAMNTLDEYRIICQFNSKLPSFKFKPHVMTLKWIPQQALLNHPTTKLFVTHGGIKSITETICAEVPTLIVPFFYDQVRNGHLLIKSGAGLAQDETMSAESILRNCRQILSNHSEFKLKTKKLHTFFNDRPISPLEYGTFWAEYFLRHKNQLDTTKNSNKFSTKLRRRNLSFFQANFIDLLLIFLILILSIIAALIYLFKFFKFLLLNSLLSKTKILHSYYYYDVIRVPFRVVSFFWFQILINSAMAIKRKIYTAGGE